MVWGQGAGGQGAGGQGDCELVPGARSCFTLVGGLSPPPGWLLHDTPTCLVTDPVVANGGGLAGDLAGVRQGAAVPGLAIGDLAVLGLDTREETLEGLETPENPDPLARLPLATELAADALPGTILRMSHAASPNLFNWIGFNFLSFLVLNLGSTQAILLLGFWSLMCSCLFMSLF